MIGVGNAGITVLDLMALEDPGVKGLFVINNDADSLGSSIIPDRILVPEGDPRKGFQAIDEEFGRVIKGAPAVLLCGGLGGETGSFLLPALAVRAKAEAITTLACVGLPFSFEGRHRREHAASSLKKLYEHCDAVAVIDNEALSGGSPSTTAVGEAFKVADRTLLASLLALQGMLGTSGPVKITRSDISGVLGMPGSQTHFGFGRAKGSNRLHEALERTLKSPLLVLPGKGSALVGTPTVLLFVRGPKDLSFAEVKMAVAEIERIAGENCHVKVGVQAEESTTFPLELFIIASSKGGTANAAELPIDPPLSLSDGAQHGKNGGKEVQVADTTKQVKPPKKTAAKQTQGTLNLDPYQRGRFDRSEPTIMAGEDLDVPTFLRKGIKITPPRKQ